MRDIGREGILVLLGPTEDGNVKARVYQCGKDGGAEQSFLIRGQ